MPTDPTDDELDPVDGNHPLEDTEGVDHEVPADLLELHVALEAQEAGLL